MNEPGGAKIKPGLAGRIERVVPLEWTLAQFGTPASVMDKGLGKT
jgi:hypothetical protein